MGSISGFRLRGKERKGMLCNTIEENRGERSKRARRKRGPVSGSSDDGNSVPLDKCTITPQILGAGKCALYG